MVKAGVSREAATAGCEQPVSINPLHACKLRLPLSSFVVLVRAHVSRHAATAAPLPVAPSLIRTVRQEQGNNEPHATCSFLIGLRLPQQSAATTPAQAASTPHHVVIPLIPLIPTYCVRCTPYTVRRRLWGKPVAGTYGCLSCDFNMMTVKVPHSFTIRFAPSRQLRGIPW
jgi:hypothetical protein